MFNIYTKCGRAKQELFKTCNTLEEAQEHLKRLYDSMSCEAGSLLLWNGARIVVNNEPILNVVIKEVT